MHRHPRARLGAALWAALAALLVPLCARPALAVPSGPPFVRPSLFEGIEPIEADEFGISPDFEYFVYQDDDGFHVVRLFTGEETFRLRFVEGVITAGFDPEDERLFLLEPLAGGDFRFRYVDPLTGVVLRDARTSDQPEVRTNFNGSITVLLESIPRRTRALVFDHEGAAAFRRTYSASVRPAMDLFFPLVAFLDPQAAGRTRIEVVNAASRNVTLRQTVGTFSVVGFAPFSPAFVIAEPLSTYNFRVRLFDVLDGDPLLFRSFGGPVNAGFTPDGSLLGIRSRRGFTQETFLFRTHDGSILP